MEIEASRTIDAPASRVWALICDLEHWPDFIGGVDTVERLDDGTGFEVGTRWRETRTMFGKQDTQVMEVTGLAEGRAYTVEADSRGTHYTSRFTLEDRDGRTDLQVTFGAASGSMATRVLGATLGRLFSGATRKALQRDLDDIAAAAERPDDAGQPARR